MLETFLNWNNTVVVFCLSTFFIAFNILTQKLFNVFDHYIIHNYCFLTFFSTSLEWFFLYSFMFSFIFFCLFLRHIFLHFFFRILFDFFRHISILYLQFSLFLCIIPFTFFETFCNILPSIDAPICPNNIPRKSSSYFLFHVTLLH